MFPLRIFFAVQSRIVIAAIVSLTALVATTFFVYAAYAGSLPAAHGPVSVSGIVYLSAPATVPSAAAVVRPLTREMHIANNGLMLLRGAEVLSLSGSSIKVDVSWSSGTLTWTLMTNNNTVFLTSTGQKATMEDIKVGDYLTVTGTMYNTGSEPTIAAKYVRM
jgi:hypothetical protein